jgi:hypothetical protein
MESKELANKQGTELATQSGASAQETLRSDVVVPRLLLMQQMSEFVTNKEKTPEGKRLESGMLIRSTNKEVLAQAEDLEGGAKELEIIPLSYTNTWVIQMKVGQKYEYKAQMPRTARNENDQFEWKEKDGSEWRRVKTINLFCLLGSDIEAEAAELKKLQETGEQPDLNKMLLPVVISFRSTSFQAGKEVATHFAKAQSLVKYGAKPYGTSMILRILPEKNDKGAYYVMRTAPGKKVPKENFEKAGEWATVVSTSNVKVDSEGTDEEASTGQPRPAAQAAPNDQF